MTLTSFFLLAASPLHAATTWKPEKPIEIVATNAPGGGSDRIIRIMINVLQERRLFAVPVNVANKPGAGGSVAYAYVNNHPGDAHFVVLGSKTILTNNLMGRGPSPNDLTPIAHLFGEYIAITVKPDSSLKSAKDLVDRMRKEPAAFSFGVATALGGANHQGASSPLKTAGVDVRRMRTVIFGSGGQATTSMLGGHVDVVPISAAFAGSMAKQGQVRVLAVSAPSRLPLMPDTPTWREQGIDAVATNWRLLLGPKGMSDAQVAFWEDAMRRLMEADEWKKEMDANGWRAELIRGGELRKFLERENAEMRTFLTEVGLIK